MGRCNRGTDPRCNIWKKPKSPDKKGNRKTKQFEKHLKELLKNLRRSIAVSLPISKKNYIIVRAIGRGHSIGCPGTKIYPGSDSMH